MAGGGCTCGMTTVQWGTTAQVAHHINKYMKNNKINVDRGTLGFSCATCATCYPLIPIGKPKSTVAHCASVRHSGVPLKRSVS
jgi:hypothetical protein